MPRILIGFLCVFIAGSPRAWAAQMEGPTVYEVEPSLAVISDDGSQAYYVQSGSYGWTDESFGPKKNSTLIRLDLNQKLSAKVDLDPSVGGTKFRLVGFAPTGELIGYSRGNVWAYAPATRALRVLFTAPKKQKIRWAALQAKAGPVFVSLAPGDHPDDSSSETLSFAVHDLITLSWNGKQVQHEQTRTRREVLPPGSVFDESNVLFFPMRDIYQCEWHKGLRGGRCLPVSTEEVFIDGGSPGTIGARSIAVSKKMVYVYINRLGGSGAGFVMRFPKVPLPERADLFDKPEEHYRQVMTHYADSLRSMETLQTDVVDAMLCASDNGVHVLIGAFIGEHGPESKASDRHWFKVTNDSEPVKLEFN